MYYMCMLACVFVNMYYAVASFIIIVKLIAIVYTMIRSAVSEGS